MLKLICIDGTSLTGTVVRDVVSLGNNISLSNFDFIVATNMTSKNQRGDQFLDGIVGMSLAPVDGDVSGTMPLFFQSLLDQKKVDAAQVRHIHIYVNLHQCKVNNNVIL